MDTTVHYQPSAPTTDQKTPNTTTTPTASPPTEQSPQHISPTSHRMPPHGGQLLPRLVTPSQREQLLQETLNAPTINIDDRVMADVRLFASGAISPLTGFMGKEDYETVLSDMRLVDGTVWPVPITLPMGAADSSPLRLAERVRLVYKGQPVAVVDIDHIFEPSRAEEATAVYGTDDPAHPGVSALYDAGEYYVAGDIHVLDTAFDTESPLTPYVLSPAETREAFARQGWQTIVAFQTRNPIHRAHEYLQKCALEMVDGLLIHPLIGETKSDDIDAHTRFQCYEKLIAHYYPRERVLLGAFPAAMRYAGPREAIFHAICRQNYGCTHIIIGRDHAGVGDYYGTYDAQNIFNQFQPHELAIQTVRFEHAFYCHTCGAMATSKTCPHPAEAHLHLSGTRVREMVRRGKFPPKEFTRPEVARILVASVGDRRVPRRRRTVRRRVVR